ncbi:MAG: beta-phosphoglucomutase [Microscillaceae bacterium]|nr:beta-phosphoglucomutase [Microscillaceae bacterium]
MANLRACIFDLDGVIVDTAKYHFLAWKRLAKELDIDFTEEDNEKLKGVSRIESLKIILDLGNRELDDKTFQEKMDLKNQWFLDYIYKMTPDEVLPGVKEFLEELQQLNIKIALGSASKNAQTILNQIHMTHYFEVIMDGTTITKAKPDPEVFVQAAKQLGVPPKSCVVFEDAEKGVEAALQGKMYVVGIGSAEILKDAHWVVPGFEHLHWEQLVNHLIH